MARSSVARALFQLGGEPVYRENFVSDHGNIILDVVRPAFGHSTSVARDSLEPDREIVQQFNGPMDSCFMYILVTFQLTDAVAAAYAALLVVLGGA